MSSSRFVNHTLVKGATASEALAAYRLVMITAADDEGVEYPAAINDPVIGVTASSAASGAPVDIVMAGIALVQVDGAASNIAVGDSICAHNDIGYGSKALGGAAGSRFCIGVALAASTADGDVIPVQISPHPRYFAA